MKKTLILLCALLSATLVSCGYSGEDVSNARATGFDEGYDEGYSDGYNEAYEEAYEDFVYELNYGVEGYSPLYVSDEIIDDLLYIVEEHNGCEYRPEEYVMIVSDFFDATRQYMTSDEREAFENIIDYCYEVEWITRNIVYDMQHPPA